MGDRDWTAAESRVVALLDRRIERVHIDMDDLALRHAVTISGRETEREQKLSWHSDGVR